MVLIIDHFDSFSYNLYQAIAVDKETVVARCDEISVADITGMNPELVVLSPGPCGPEETGVTLEYLSGDFASVCPTLGICLGFQAMAVAWGGVVELAPEVVHGKTLDLSLREHPVFDVFSDPLRVARYHSLCVPAASLPKELELIATHDEMAFVVEDNLRPWMGLQFHPESFLTEGGVEMLARIRTHLVSRSC